MSAQYKSILKYVGLFGSIQGLSMLIGLVRSKLIAVLLGPGGMGLSSILNTALQLLSNSTNLGINFSAVKGLSEIDNDDTETLNKTISVVRTWSFIAAGLGFAVTVFAAPIINMISFSWGNHTLHYLMLAPTVALLAITGGESAILKSTRRMKNLATVQLFTVIMSVIIAVPIYYFFGESGIVPVIFLTALATMLATIFYSYRYYPLRLKGIRQYVKEGTPMVKLGLSFVTAGILGSGVEMYIRSLLNYHGNLEMVGLYYAAFSIAITYPSTFLSSLENDYFARLSAVNTDNAEVRRMVNAQIEVLVSVMIPLLAILMFALPVVVPLLFSSKFSAAVPMAQVTLIAMLLRSASLPVEYISLAKGESKTYLFIEIISNIVITLSITLGFFYKSLWGMGAGWAVAYGIVFLFTLVYFRYKWQFSLSGRSKLLIVLGVSLLIALLNL